MRIRSMRWPVVLAITCAGCAAAGTDYAPLACDPARAGELAFGFQEAGAFFPRPGTVANGSRFLFIDGACRYWAPGRGPSEVVTGVLDDAQLAELNAELLTGPWPEVDGEHVTGCCDGETSGVGRDEIRASAYSFAPRSDALSLLLSTSRRWGERLAGLGTPLSEGPVRLELMEIRPPSRPPTDAFAWPLGTPLDSTLGEAWVVARVYEGDDASTLRATRRSGAFVDGATYANFLVNDVVPFADDNGCLRPFFPGACNELRQVP